LTMPLQTHPQTEHHWKDTHSVADTTPDTRPDTMAATVPGADTTHPPLEIHLQAQTELHIQLQT